MSATITIPADLEQRIAGRAAAQGKQLEQVAVEMLEMTLDQLEDYEATEISLTQARAGKTKPMRQFLEELRQEFGFPMRRDELQS
ncbi:MAG: type II toxin-antitoxin system RelB family antitoxin [Blastocatellia bacterium]